MHSIDALFNAIRFSAKPITLLVGAPASCCRNENASIPDVLGMTEIAKDYIKALDSKLYSDLESCLDGKAGAQLYQTCLEWIQSNINQDAVNEIIRLGVSKALIPESGHSDLKQCDGDETKWNVPEGLQYLAKAIASKPEKFSDSFLTTNFDPLLSIALKKEGIRTNRIITQTDGSLPIMAASDPSTKNVIHLHGYWLDSDTLHTPSQVSLSRKHLQASLQRILKKTTLLVVAYGGWDDVIRKSLGDLVLDESNELDIIWCFFEKDEEFVRRSYTKIFDTFSPSISRGRFRSYYGIECWSLFRGMPEIFGISSSGSQKQADDHPVQFKPLSITETINSPIRRLLQKRLNDALKLYSNQPTIWVNPYISNIPETDDSSAKDKQCYSIDDLVSSPSKTVITAPPEFGLTSLSIELQIKALELLSQFWLRVDLDEMRPGTHAIREHIDEELSIFNVVEKDVKAIIIDSWRGGDNANKILTKISERFAGIPVYVMRTIDTTHLLGESQSINLLSEFRKLYLWALSRSQIRSMVSAYNDHKPIGDEERVTNKVLADIDTLNLHRTALNCITLLKVSEVDFDDNPVNRTEVIKRMLFLIFNNESIPKYKSKPDVHDCEFVLGRFCEELIRGNEYYFTREGIIKSLTNCCKDQLFDTDVSLVFDILMQNNIIVNRGALFSFRFAYWIYYFAAHRMRHSVDFAKYMLADLNYSKYPEIIEYYTGIDRSRTDAVEILIKDVRDAHQVVREKTGLPDDFNPLRAAKWNPGEAETARMREEIASGIQGSNLPIEVKDAYADSNYDRTRPYNQEIRRYLYSSSYDKMAMIMKAASRALRNSDFVSPDQKRELFKEITNCWNQVAKVIFVMMPILAEDGWAEFDGTGFQLCGNFGDTFEKRIVNICAEIPINIVMWTQDDIFSQKMMPLFADYMESSGDDLNRHSLALLMIKCKPEGWREIVDAYIRKEHMHSFYLFNVYRKLKIEYRQGIMSEKNLRIASDLIKLCASKHFLKIANPNSKDVKKISERDVLPERTVECS